MRRDNALLASRWGRSSRQAGLEEKGVTEAHRRRLKKDALELRQVWLVV
jgi:hypothetical protein